MKNAAPAMTSQPPSSHEIPPLPPRHRPALGDLMQETTERDLWAFDDEPNTQEDAWDELPPTRTSGKEIPQPRERPPLKMLATTDSPASGHATTRDQIRINVNKPPIKNRPPGSSVRQSTPESTFDDLESWNPAPVNPEIVAPPAGGIPEPTQPPYPLEPVAAAGTPVVESTPDNVPSTGEDDEFGPVARDPAAPTPLRPHVRFSKTEWAGLLGLLVLLLAGGITILGLALNHLPTETQQLQTNDFPIKGSYLTIDRATSYWREPVTEGASTDTFRPGTRLLPVLELSVRGGPAVIRVFFHNEDRLMVGDVVTQTVRGDGTCIIPATAGFDDFGMHAAYRTGQGKRWTIEVLEASPEKAAVNEFQKLLEMNISTDLH